MHEQDEINALRKELQQLHEQLQAQQHTIQRLHQRLLQLSRAPQQPVIPKPDASPSWSLENFIGLRVIHLIGIVVLVIGLSIGVKYAIDRDLISPQLRILLAYAAGALLLFLAYRLKKKYLLFSAILFSGAMASLYFTTYAAFVYYGMIPFGVAFAVMAVLTFFTAAQAVAYNRQEIALLGLIGAYGIPFLISQNSDRADLFFLYIFIINLGIAYLCWKKEWKITGRTAQTLTWLLFLGWSATRFQQKDTTIGVVFLLLFFTLFSFIGFVQKIRSKSPLSLNDAYQQFLNNAALYTGALFIFASSMEDEQLATVSGLTAVFVGVQAALYHRWLPEERMLFRLHFFQSLSLVVLFILFRWDGFTVTFLWLLVAVAVFAWGVAAKSISLRMGGIALMGLTLLKLVLYDSLQFSPVQKVIAYLTLGILLLIVSFFYQKYKEKLFRN